MCKLSLVSTHSRPKAAGSLSEFTAQAALVSTHSRPKAAGAFQRPYKHKTLVSTHSRPKAAGTVIFVAKKKYVMFQHTAARRRLATNKKGGRNAVLCFNTQPPEGGWKQAKIFNALERVSTHSRPKAAGIGNRHDLAGSIVSTHSRPKAAGIVLFACSICIYVSTHSRPKAAGSTVMPCVGTF